MASLNLVENSQNLTTMLNQLEDGEPIVLERNGESVAALITIRDLNLLKRLIKAEEDRMDLAEAEKILAETKEDDWIDFDKLKTELSL